MYTNISTSVATVSKTQISNFYISYKQHRYNKRFLHALVLICLAPPLIVLQNVKQVVKRVRTIRNPQT